MNLTFALRCASLLLLLSASLAAAAVNDVIGLRSHDLPVAPKRVVVLEFVFAESLAALDLIPVGVVNSQLYPDWIGYDAQRLRAATDVGTRQQPSLEAIAKLKPDLIIGMTYRHAALFDALKRIAPTVLYEFTPPDFKTDQLTQTLAIFDSLATITGRKAQGAEVKRALFAKLAANQQRLKAAGLSGQTFTFVHDLGLTDNFWTFTSNSMAGGLARELGLSIWPNQPSKEGVDYVTTAQLLTRPASSNLLFITNSDADVGLNAKLVSPIWKNIPARRAGNMILIERNIWSFGGPMSAARLADAITDSLLKLHGVKH